MLALHPTSCDKTLREIVLCLLKTAFVPRKCHLIKQGDANQSHLTLRKAGQVKLIPGALPRQFVHRAQICRAEPTKTATTKNLGKRCQLPVTNTQEQTISHKHCWWPLHVERDRWRKYPYILYLGDLQRIHNFKAFFSCTHCSLTGLSTHISVKLQLVLIHSNQVTALVWEHCALHMLHAQIFSLLFRPLPSLLKALQSHLLCAAPLMAPAGGNPPGCWVCSTVYTLCCWIDQSRGWVDSLGSLVMAGEHITNRLPNHRGNEGIAEHMGTKANSWTQRRTAILTWGIVLWKIYRVEQKRKVGAIVFKSTGFTGEYGLYIQIRKWMLLN